VQLRRAVVPPPGEALGDMEVIFRLATRLGFADRFWNGDIDAAYRHQLGPSGVSLEQLRASPQGVRVPLQTRFAKHAALDANGIAAGFATASRKVEFWSETLRERGYAAQPDFVRTQIDPSKSAAFPLVLTCAKPTLFLQSQFRALPALRKRARTPEVELHPTTAAARGIAEGSWVLISTPSGGARAVARFNASLDPRVIVGEHGWWQASSASDAPGFDPFSSNGANFNLTVDPTLRDPISGTPSNRANVCEIRPASPPA
jgi:anaerobic selenocysteine-containing dehydrogenase